MSITVEDGTGIAGAVSYVSAQTVADYATARGLTFDPAAAGAEGACVRATEYIDATYMGRFPGIPTFGRLQGLQWPRVGAYVRVPDNGRFNALFYGGGRYYDYEFLDGLYYIPNNVVPREIIKATCEGALREIIKPGALTPDLKRGGAIQRVKAGSVEVEYSGSAPAGTSFQSIGLALASLLMPSSSFSGRAVRG